MSPTTLFLRVCLHVAPSTAVPSILAHGLIPRIGPLSEQLETRPAVYLFPSWPDLVDANWLFQEAWPYPCEPALLAVDTTALALDLEAGFEVVALNPIEASRITVLAPGESGWDAAERRFYDMGGRSQSLSSDEVASWLRTMGHTL